MKKKLHPAYGPAKISCACGEVWETKSTVKDTKVGICAKCHPFFTGKQKLVDTAGRVERFQKRYEKFNATQKNKTTKVEAEAKPEAEEKKNEEQ